MAEEQAEEQDTDEREQGYEQELERTRQSEQEAGGETGAEAPQSVAAQATPDRSGEGDNPDQYEQRLSTLKQAARAGQALKKAEQGVETAKRAIAAGRTIWGIVAAAGAVIAAISWEIWVVLIIVIILVWINNNPDEAAKLFLKSIVDSVLKAFGK